MAMGPSDVARCVGAGFAWDEDGSYAALSGRMDGPAPP
jgi:hypothetical protein